MSVRGIIVIAALRGMSVCGLLSALINVKMVEQVNARLSKQEQFSQLGWYAAKTLRLFREYRRLVPGGNLHLKMYFLTVLGSACLLCSAWAIGFF
jgi:hypothetical protein